MRGERVTSVRAFDLIRAVAPLPKAQSPPVPQKTLDILRDIGYNVSLWDGTIGPGKRGKMDPPKPECGGESTRWLLR